VFTAIQELRAQRIGHGIQVKFSRLNPEEQKLISRVHFEVCLKSNWQLKNLKGKTFASHPILDIMRAGVNISLSTDNRTVSDVTLTDEWLVFSKTFNFNVYTKRGLAGDYLNFARNAVEAAFLPLSAKQELQHKMNAYHSVLSELVKILEQ